MLNADLLEEATRVLGVKTYSAAVNLALEEAIRMNKIQRLTQFFGKGLWQGDLAEMRDDSDRPRRRHSPARKKAHKK